MTRACRPLTAWRRLAVPFCAAWLLAPGPADSDSCTTLSFGSQTSGATGSDPVAVAVGDFDHDGRLDLVTANGFPTNTISVLAGIGNGAFGAPSTATSAPSPVDVATGDLDRDGKLDLVVASGTATQVTVHAGNGTTIFTTGSLANVLVKQSRILLADFDRDGRLDLVVVSDDADRVLVLRGLGNLSFDTGTPIADIPLSGQDPVAAAAGDFDRDGDLDLAVALKASGEVQVFRNDGASFTPEPAVSVGVAPVDVFAADLDRDGWLDLVTANAGPTATVSVLEGAAGASFTPRDAVTAVGQPARLSVVDLDRDGALDLVVLDETALSPRLMAFKGDATFPSIFGTAPYPVALGTSTLPRGLATGDFTSEGRVDLVTARYDSSAVVVVRNESGSTCALSSFGDAPRSYPAGDGPQAGAAADFDRDGRQDLVVANNLGGTIAVLRAAPGGYGAPSTYAVSPAPRGVATADFDFDGNADVVAVTGANPGRVKLLPGDGTGLLDDSGGFSIDLGNNLAAVAVGDFDGDGGPDVAVASEGSDQVFVLPGNGLGGFRPAIATLVGAAPRALVAGFFNADTRLDLAVACSGSGNVWVLLGNGDGSFTVDPIPVAVGANPWGIAAGDLDANGTTDLVTADHGASRVSVRLGSGTGTFAPPPVAPASYAVDGFPTGVALLQVGGSARPDIVVSTAQNHTVNLLLDDGASGTGFVLPPPGSNHPVRLSPQAVVPVDADGDGLLDVAVPCKTSDAVVVLLTRPPTLRQATRVAVEDQPFGAVAADLDGDGDLDLAVANTAANSVSVLSNDNGLGTFLPFGSALVAPGAPTVVVAADFDRDGILDLAATQPTRGTVAVWRGLVLGLGTYGGRDEFPAGSLPDDLVAADVDRDGKVDLLVSNQLGAGTVTLLKNTSAAAGSIAFAAPGVPDVYAVGEAPTALFVADLNRDGWLDFAVANDANTAVDGVTVRYADGLGSFFGPIFLSLAVGDTPVSLTGADFDGDGDVDLAAGLFTSDTVAVFEKNGGVFAAPDRIPAPDLTLFAAAADLNRDGKVDLAVAAMGLKLLRGNGSLALAEPFAKGEDVVAGLAPGFAVVADWNHDGWPDVAVVNGGSDDVSILLSTACQARRLEVTAQPPACGAGLPLYRLQAVVEARDDGGNLAACTVGDVTAAIAPDTGALGAVLSGPSFPLPPMLPSLPLVSGVASFTTLPNGKSLTIDRPGRRYRLQFSLPGLPPANSESFTLGAQLEILGPAAFCTSASYTTEGSYDAYSWTLAPPVAPPFAFTPSVLLQGFSGFRTLGVSTWVDGCEAPASRGIFAGVWVETTVTATGPVVVCVDCIGGTLTATEKGGGPITSRQWGYRTQSGSSTIVPIPSETGQTYALKGTDFPGPGSYWVVVTSTVECPSTPVVSLERQVTVLAEVDGGEAQFLAVTARNDENKLQWVYSTVPDEVCIRWNTASSPTSTCTFPLVRDCPTTGTDGPGWHRIVSFTADTKASWDHVGLTLDRDYCYAVFVHNTAPPGWSQGRLVKARPFDASGAVKWAYSTGATAVVPPSVGKFGIVAVSNDRTVHAVTRGGSTGGIWPGGWMPQALSGVVHTRSPIVPFGSGLLTVGGKSVLFVADDEGIAQAVDTETGQALWGTGPSFTGVDPSAGTARMTGAPGAILQQYGGVRDLVLVGSRSKNAANPSEFFGLKVDDGSLVAPSFSGDPGDPANPLGPVLGSPSVDYANGLVYFTSNRFGSGDNIWCVRVNPTGAPEPFSHVWSRGDLGEFDSSPVLLNGRVYVANNTGDVYSLRADNGGGDRTSTTEGDGPVKGFVFPDRDRKDLFFASNTKVWRVADENLDGSPMTKIWEWAGGLNPSLVLFWREQRYLYVGGSSGTLWQLNLAFSPGHLSFAKPLTLGNGKGRIGAPSLDTGVSPRLLIVGSESGVLYGVEVPF